MTPDRHARIQEIFEAAIDLPERQRPAFLDGECADDADLRERVARLIESAEGTVTLDGSWEQNARVVVKECPQCSRYFDTPLMHCPDDGAELTAGFSGPLLIAGKYRIEKRLGSGGMGSVFLARHIGLEKYFALKLINVDGPIPAAYRARFETEALALGRLKHPNIVDVTDFGIDDRGGGLPYLVMEYLDGGTLRERVRGSKIPFPQALAWLRDIAAGIDAAHAQDIIHGDLKPANVLIGNTLKIVDFGLARLPSANLEAAPSSNTIRGTPAYMAPELFRCEDASKASDRFAFGVLAYETLTGETPFGRQIPEVQKNQRQAPAAPSDRNPALPRELDGPLMALLNPVPQARPASASAAVSALESAWIAAEQRKWRAREILPRIGIAAAAAGIIVLAASISTRSDTVKMLEERTIDWRFATLPAHPPDPRLMVVAIDDETLARDPRPLATWDADFARMIDRLFDAGAQAVAIDILLPDWSRSSEFARAIVAHADRMVLAKYSSGDEVTGTECIGPLTAAVLGSQRYGWLFGFVNLKPDEDGKIRRAQLSFLDRNGGEAPSFARRAVEVAGFTDAAPERLWIDDSVRASDIPVVSWLAAARLDQHTPLFVGKLVFLSASFSGVNDLHRIPDTSAKNLISGAVLHALIVNTILQNFRASQPPWLRSVLPVTIASSSTILLALMFPHRPLRGRACAAMLFLGWAVFAFVLFRTRLALIAVAAPEIAIVLTAIAAWLIPPRLRAFPEVVS